MVARTFVWPELYDLGAPWRMLDRMRRLQDEMTRVLGPEAEQGPYPALNVWTGEDGAIVQALVPGIPADGIDLAVKGHVLTLRGERKAPNGDQHVHVRERDLGAFSRDLELPFMIDREKIEASCRNGVLKVRLVRAEEDRPRRIEIKTR